MQALNVQDYLTLSIEAIALLGMFMVVNGIVAAAADCWRNASRKPQQAAAPVAPAYTYACPLTCELPANPRQEATPPVAAAQSVEVAALQEEQEAAPKKLTYAQATFKRASDLFGFEIKSKKEIKAALINKADLSFMGAVNLERSGRDFYEAANLALDNWEAARHRKHLERIASRQQAS